MLADSQPLPVQIRVERRSPAAVRYVLPRRPLGNYRYLALVLVVLAGIASTFSFGWFAGIANWGQQMPGIAVALFAAIGLISLVPMVLVPLAIAAAIFWGHSEIEIDVSTLWLGEFVGPLRWRRRCQLTDVRRLVVEAASTSHSGARTQPAADGKFSAIRVELARGKPRWAGLGYPRVAASAGPGARSASQPGPGKRPAPGHGRARAVAVTEAVPVIDRRNRTSASSSPGQLDQADRSRRQSDLRSTAAGLRRGTAGLFGFACIWLAFTAVFTSAAVWSLLFGGPAPAQGQAFAGGVASAMFSLLLSWAIGIGMMVAALHMARHRAAIAVAGDRLLVVQMGLFGEQKRVWERDELQSIQVGPSGVEINDQPASSCNSCPSSAANSACWQGARWRNSNGWPRGCARHFISAPPKEIDLILADVETRPANSSAVVDEVDGVLTISVPPADWRKSLPGGIISIGSDRAEFAVCGGPPARAAKRLARQGSGAMAAGDLAAIASARDTTMNKRLMGWKLLPLAGGKPVKLLTRPRLPGTGLDCHASPPSNGCAGEQSTAERGG